jgi:hypothetical protein
VMKTDDRPDERGIEGAGKVELGMREDGEG